MYLRILFLLQAMVLASDEFSFSFGDDTQEMQELGKKEYQLIRERSNLPQYGNCWKSAVAQVNYGCKYLTEETQSDIALLLTNCFLEMSGHEPYKCELDKKPNLRAICINSMSDRAFSVYTEFYTHTLNMCWFLRGQIWQETISQNTFKVGEQLAAAAEGQRNLLKVQKESLEMQEKMLEHGKYLDKILDDLTVTSKAHHDILKVTADAVGSLQAWIIGEVSWFESVGFYILICFFVLIATTAKRTAPVRLLLLLVVCCGFATERFIICKLLSIDYSNSGQIYTDISTWTWYSRYFFQVVIVLILIYAAYRFVDANTVNNILLNAIHKQNIRILNYILQMASNNNNNNLHCDKLDLINESETYLESKLNDLHYRDEKNDFASTSSINILYGNNGNEENGYLKSNNQKVTLQLGEIQNTRYNLRSRQGTPNLSK